MKALLLFCAVLYQAAARPSPSVGFLEDLRKTRIMYGEPATIGQFPHQLSVVMKAGDYHTCGAILINAVTALTAAHCVAPSTPQNYLVRAGQTIQGEAESEHDIASIFQHELFDQENGTLSNDISILYLASPVNLTSDNTSAIRICRHFDGDHEGALCAISGWGTTEDGPSPQNLYYANTTVLSNSECSTMIEPTGAEIIDSHICVYNGVQGGCSGDSGGPLTCIGCAAGIASWVIQTAGVCNMNFPTVYTRINSFEEWIDLRVPGLP